MKLVPFRSPLLRFAWHVLVRFHEHRGLLLSGAVAYNVLLSIVPLAALLVLGLSQVTDQETLVRVLAAELRIVLPGQTADLMQEVTTLSKHGELFGVVSLASLLFFGSLAFRVLGEAMTAIFANVRRASKSVRGFWASAALPYLFIGVLGAGLIGITLLATLVERLSGRTWRVLGFELALDPIQRWPLLVGAVVGEFLLFTLIYLLLPGIQVRVRDAAVAAAVVVVQWEVIRRLLGWYFDRVSTIGVVYGSLATVIIALMSAEIAAIILLLGAQVLAELTRARQKGIRWQDLATTARVESTGVTCKISHADPRTDVR